MRNDVGSKNDETNCMTGDDFKKMRKELGQNKQPHIALSDEGLKFADLTSKNYRPYAATLQKFDNHNNYNKRLQSIKQLSLVAKARRS